MIPFSQALLIFYFAFDFHGWIIRRCLRFQLTIARRKVHRADAHHLDPVVMIGGDGLTLRS